jgi:predicted Fe-Mo cluster-binding NifX family protein
MNVFQTHGLIITINVWGELSDFRNHDIHTISFVTRQNEREFSGDAPHCVTCGVNLAVSVVLCKNYGHPQTGKLRQTTSVARMQ